MVLSRQDGYDPKQEVPSGRNKDDVICAKSLEVTYQFKVLGVDFIKVGNWAYFIYRRLSRCKQLGGYYRSSDWGSL